MKAKSNKIKSKKNVILGFVIAVIVAIVGYCSFCLISNAADISRLKAESQELNTKYEQQLDENKISKDTLKAGGWIIKMNISSKRLVKRDM